MALFSKSYSTGFSVIISGIVLFSLGDTFSDLTFTDRNFWSVIATSCIVSGVAIVLSLYLKEDRTDSTVVRFNAVDNLNNSQSNGGAVLDCEGRLKKLEASVSILNKSNFGLNEKEKDDFVLELRDIVLSGVTDSMISNFESKYSKESQDKFEINEVRDRFSDAKERLFFQVVFLRKRGNVNLIIGVLTTVVAIIILATSLLNYPGNLTRDDLIGYFVPRVTMSFFVEVFSFFFLNLYKSGLVELKYFQNEITNLEMKIISLIVCLRKDDIESIRNVTSELVKTERNFILNKGQSTVDLERSKIESDSLKGAISVFEKILVKANK